MAIFLENAGNPGLKLAIWKTDEPVEDLCSILDLPLPALPARVESRQKEWLAIRILLKILLNSKSIPVLEYDEMGKPSLPDFPYSISISHTKSYVGILLSLSTACGVDLEIIHPRIKKIAGRFLSDEEQKHWNSGSPLPDLYITWGAKEVLYKIYGKGGILFKQHLRVEPFSIQDEGIVMAGIEIENYSKTHTVHYRQMGELILTYATE